MDEQKKNKKGSSSRDSINNKSATATMKKVTVYIRNTDDEAVQRDRWVKLEGLEAETLADMKTEVVKALQISYSNFALETKNIRVFWKDDNDTPHPQIFACDKKTLLRTEGVYFAVEYFHVAPMDMFRNVKHSQIKPSVPSNPKYVSMEEQSWTEVSPVYCAAMKGSERTFPCFGVSAHQNLIAHGISLRGKDEATGVLEATDPFRPIAEDEQPSFASSTLEQYYHLAEQNGAQLHPDLGILETTVSHTYSGHIVTPKPVPENRKRGRAKKGLASERLFCFRYVLKKGTDLTPFGMALVYDNSSKYHWSLIREQVTKPEREWEGKNLFLPFEFSYQFRNSPRGSHERNDLLLNSILSLSKEEPETSDAQIPNHLFEVFPKVAALFALHDVTMRASTEPVPPENFDDTSQKMLYWAALVLFRLDSDSDIRMALEELQAANYHVEDIDSPCRETLLWAMNAAMRNEDINEMELEREAKMDADEALFDGVEVLNESVRGALLGTKTPSTTQATPDKDSPESTSTQATSVTTISRSSDADHTIKAYPGDVTKSHSDDSNSSNAPSIGG